MELNVKIKDKTIKIKLPETIVDEQVFTASVHNTSMQAKWHKLIKTLYIRATDQDPWRSIHLRSRSMTKFGDDDEQSVNMEFVAGGSADPRIIDASVSRYIPGQDDRAKSKGVKNLTVRSQITGKVLKVLVQKGDRVTSGQTLIIIEAMKMENRILASRDGVIDNVHVKESQPVITGAELFRFTSS